MRAATTCIWFALVAVLGGLTVEANLPPPTFVMNLDLPPQQRWNGIVPLVVNAHGWANSLGCVLGGLNNSAMVPVTSTQRQQIASALQSKFNEYYQELTGIAAQCAAAGHPEITAEFLSVATTVHALYHAESGSKYRSRAPQACTAILTADPNTGLVSHFRNMDGGMGCSRNIVVHILFQKGGQTIFEANDWYWFGAGVMTASMAGVASMQENVREGDPLQPVSDIVANLQAGHMPQVFQFRWALTQPAPITFENIVANLATVPLLAGEFMVVAGAGVKQGAVITRVGNTTNTQIATFPSDGWFMVQTNYDRDIPDPSNDPRRSVATTTLNLFGPAVGGQTTMGFAVISTFPVENNSTLYTVVMQPTTGLFLPYVRQPSFAQNTPFPPYTPVTPDVMNK